MVIHSSYSRRLQLIASIVALRHSSPLVAQSWRNYLGLRSRQSPQHRCNLVISRLQALVQRNNVLRSSIEANKPGKSTATVGVAFIASFSLFSSSKSKSSVNCEAQKESGDKIAQTDTVWSLNETIQHSDQLFDENHFQEAYDLLMKSSNPEAYEIKWRMARVLFNLSKSTPSPKKEQMIRESFQLATEALALNDNDFATHKWYSILLDAKSVLDGIKERVTQLENFEMHLKRALELNPADATSWHILGQLYYGLAALPWYQRKIMATMSATPPEGSYEVALECFEKAEHTNPNFYSMNHLMLGKTYQALKNTGKAKEFLTLAANVKVLNEDDKQAKEEAATLLKKL
ncbi:AAEL003406-PA [Aedes aegypti]|uniref:Regulator of microtubule dynamics protein 1 n=2 Tax=Aedes aegypti TaxID=7159 RepID=A0A1S4F4L5_AEDAE|nr:regulator of microtubule dynamics protein 1 [Aedes aegypti]EAT45291.1 AAEL003406-PA [Aedes aegypti]